MFCFSSKCNQSAVVYIIWTSYKCIRSIFTCTPVFITPKKTWKTNVTDVTDICHWSNFLPLVNTQSLLLVKLHIIDCGQPAIASSTSTILTVAASPINGLSTKSVKPLVDLKIFTDGSDRERRKNILRSLWLVKLNVLL